MSLYPPWPLSGCSHPDVAFMVGTACGAVCDADDARMTGAGMGMPGLTRDGVPDVVDDSPLPSASSPPSRMLSMLDVSPMAECRNTVAI